MVCSDLKIAWAQGEKRFYAALEKVWGFMFGKRTSLWWAPQVTVNRAVWVMTRVQVWISQTIQYRDRVSAWAVDQKS